MTLFTVYQPLLTELYVVEKDFALNDAVWDFLSGKFGAAVEQLRPQSGKHVTYNVLELESLSLRLFAKLLQIFDAGWLL